MTNLIAKLRVRSPGGDRGAASVEVGLAAILFGVTAVAAVTLFGGDIATW
jgi:Flp pilus assembly pilin Flp